MRKMRERVRFLVIFLKLSKDRFDVIHFFKDIGGE